MTPVPVFPKLLTPGPDPGPNEKRRILPESTPVIQTRSHLWQKPEMNGFRFFKSKSNPAFHFKIHIQIRIQKQTILKSNSYLYLKCYHYYISLHVA